MRHVTSRRNNALAPFYFVQKRFDASAEDLARLAGKVAHAAAFDDVEKTEPAELAVAPTDKPLWLSFTLRDDVDPDDMPEPQLRSGQSVAHAARLTLRIGADAMLFNCSRPEVMESALAAAATVVQDGLPLGVYANAFASQDEDGAANEFISRARDDMSPQAYCGWADRWVAAGATIVGRCCGMGTRHIYALSTKDS